MTSTAVPALNLLAESANAVLAAEAPAVLALLSQRGKRFFFPAKGILAQGAEARQKATAANATIGIATEGGQPMHLASVHRHFHGLTPAEAYDYAPSYGKLDLRQAWAAKQRAETPSLAGATTSLPVVTNALTHGLAVVGDLFLDEGDIALSSDLMWENYNLSWETRLGARIVTYPFFDQRLSGFNITAFSQALAQYRGRKLLVSLNFPNNPSGYTPTVAEQGAIANALMAAAEAGTRLVVVVDDAYYGMFFDSACARESIFGRLAQAHPNLLAVKVDGGTKEAFVWGLRVGFLTYGVKGGTPAVYKALEDKTAGIIRAVISNVTASGQAILLKALSDPGFKAEQAAKVRILESRAAVTRSVCTRTDYADCWDVYPFNSGYFMCLRLKDVTAEAVRLRLLAEHQVGAIALGQRELRVAFSCLEEAQIPGVFTAIAAAVRAERGR